jgi:histidine triad (HIT) family protein
MSYDNNNPFAKILRGELSCVKVAEDDATLAIMDLMPQADGHVLVIPKEPAAQIFELSGDARSARAAHSRAFRVTRRLHTSIARGDGTA